MRWLLESEHGLRKGVLRPQFEVKGIPGPTKHLGHCVWAPKAAKYCFWRCYNPRKFEQERFLLWHLLLALCHGSHVQPMTALSPGEAPQCECMDLPSWQ